MMLARTALPPELKDKKMPTSKAAPMELFVKTRHFSLPMKQTSFLSLQIY